MLTFTLVSAVLFSQNMAVLTGDFTEKAIWFKEHGTLRSVMIGLFLPNKLAGLSRSHC